MQKSKPKPTLRLFTRAEIAQIFGVTPMRVTKWAAAGMPVADRGGRGRESKYNLHAVLAWEVARQVKARGGSRAGAPTNLGLERARLARAQTRRTELQVKTREGELLERSEVVRDGKAVIGAVRAKLLAMPSHLTQMRIIEVANRPRLEAYLHEAMEEMSNWKTRLELLEAAAKEGGETRDGTT